VKTEKQFIVCAYKKKKKHFINGNNKYLPIWINKSLKRCTLLCNFHLRNAKWVDSFVHIYKQDSFAFARTWVKKFEGDLRKITSCNKSYSGPWWISVQKSIDKSLSIWLRCESTWIRTHWEDTSQSEDFQLFFGTSWTEDWELFANQQSYTK